MCFLHALINGKKNLTIWFSSLISGTVNDLIFMALPFVDNFFHCQAIHMITPRLPLYIPCAYISFMYVCIASSQNLSYLSNYGKSAAAAISGATFYAMYDLTGVRFLWWTWHTTDAAIAERWHSVPYGSTTWTLVHLFILSFLINKYVMNSKNNQVFLKGITITAIFTTPVMMIAMGICQMYQLRLNILTPEFPYFEILQMPGKPDQITFYTVVVLLFTILLYSVITVKKTTPVLQNQKKNKLLFFIVVIYFFSLLSILQLGNTDLCVSTGVHQMIGDCDIVEYDLSNYERKKYYCPTVENGDFYVCDPKQNKGVPKNMSQNEWYTICGKKHDILSEDFQVYTFIMVFGLIQYFLMLQYYPGKKK